MSNNMKSSVELFAIALYDNGLLQGNGNHIDDLLLHFKAMHKKEIEEAREDGYKSTYTEHYSDIKFYLEGGHEQYYNETFEGNK